MIQPIPADRLERPALQQLLTDIESGKIDVVVVYKIDRLTRSLADFAKQVELFDKKTVSVVAVTQQFNTTTSMGRLTLNVLLSFAQFERELSSERVRDKILASRRRGKWGGPPLGYDVKDKKLVINPAEAKNVRVIFEPYLSLGNALARSKTYSFLSISGPAGSERCVGSSFPTTHRPAGHQARRLAARQSR